MHTHPCLSVIIPAYNAEKWLDRCIQSVLSQTLEDFEIILVDDGSTDGTPPICDRYRELDVRVKVFHRPNHGVSATRQFGLDQSSGEFIIYLDSDDFVKPSAYEKMYRKALMDQADIVECDWISIEGNMQFEDRLRTKGWNAESLASALIYDQPSYLPIYLIRRSLFQQFDIRFPTERVSYGEDTLVLIRLLAKSVAAHKPARVSHVPEHLYYYDKSANPSSLMKLSSVKMNESQVRVYEMLKESLPMDYFKRAFYGRIASYAFSAIWNDLYPEEDFRKIYLPHQKGIESSAPRNAKRMLTLTALRGKYAQARKMLWVAYPSIIKEKIDAYRRRKSGSPVD